MTLMKSAEKGEISDIMKEAARVEGVSPQFMRDGLVSGKIVIPLNKNNIGKRKICAIGDKLRTKVNVNLGASPNLSGIELEREKLEASIKYKTDAVMDLSVGHKSDEVRDMVLKESTVPVGTVPVYEAVGLVRGSGIESLTPKDLFDIILSQAKKGVDFITVHCGVTQEIVKRIKEKPRTAGIVSRGGAIMAEWIFKNNKENPFLKEFDKLLDIAQDFDITLSLGDGLRPGCIDDATDWAQIKELQILGDLTKKAWARGVQVMIEGPGHIPLNQIKENMELQKKFCHGAPFYVLGPLVTDIAPGYDHITSAIGGTLAATCGANFLCYVTPAEHLHLPTKQDLIDGLIASRIAAHAADIANGIQTAKDWDLSMAKARKALDWPKQKELAINPDIVEKRLKEKDIQHDGTCTMCGEFCSMKRMNELG